MQLIEKVTHGNLLSLIVLSKAGNAWSPSADTIFSQSPMRDSSQSVHLRHKTPCDVCWQTNTPTASKTGCPRWDPGVPCCPWAGICSALTVHILQTSFVDWVPGSPWNMHIPSSPSISDFLEFRRQTLPCWIQLPKCYLLNNIAWIPVKHLVNDKL